MGSVVAPSHPTVVVDLRAGDKSPMGAQSLFHLLGPGTQRFLSASSPCGCRRSARELKCGFVEGMLWITQAAFQEEGTLHGALLDRESLVC